MNAETVPEGALAVVRAINATHRAGLRVTAVRLTAAEIDAVEGLTGQRELFFGFPVRERGS